MNASSVLLGPFSSDRPRILFKECCTVQAAIHAIPTPSQPLVLRHAPPVLWAQERSCLTAQHVKPASEDSREISQGGVQPAHQEDSHRPLAPRPVARVLPAAIPESPRRHAPAVLQDSTRLRPGRATAHLAPRGGSQPQRERASALYARQGPTRPGRAPASAWTALRARTRASPAG